MKKLYILSLFLFFSTMFSFGQNIGINATGAVPNASAGLDISFTNKGLLVPRVALTSTTSNAPIGASVTASLLVYNTATAGASPNNVTPGYYYWNGSKWIAFMGSGGKDWSLTGNAGTIVGTNFVGTTDNVSLAFKTNNTERIRVLNTGNVGIGTTIPSYLLQANGDIFANGGWFRVSGNQGLYFQSWGGGFYMIDGTWIRTYGNKNFYHNTGIMRTDGTFQVGPSGNRFLVQTSGWVGINTTAPTSMFQMVNIGTVGATSMASFDNNGTSGVSIDVANNSTSNGYNALEGVTYGQYSGVMGLGISSDGGATYDAYGVYGHANDEQGYGVYGVRTLSGGPNTGFGGLFINDLGYTGWFGNVSDQRLKKDITKINHGLDVILNLEPVSYKFNTEKYPYLGLNTSLEYGFIAQDIEQVLPDIVKEKSLDINAAKPITTDTKIDKSGVKNFKMVNYIEIIPIIVRAVQEQQEIIENQQQKIDELENIVKELQGKVNQ